MTTDVNAEFRSLKLDQTGAARNAVARQEARIAAYDSGMAQAQLDERLQADIQAGTIRMIGDSSYEVLTGFDRGEVFSVRRATRPQEIPLILPEHNLEERDGKVSLFTAQPAWHDLGFVNHGTTSDIDVAIKEGGLDFNVLQRPVYFYDDHGNLREMPGAFVNARDDTWDGLGVVGNIYTSVQPREAFGWLQSLTGTGELEIESAGVLRGGAKTFITVALPDEIAIDPQGVNIEVRPYLALLDDHSGNRKLWAILTPWIVVCGNTHNFALRDALSRWGVPHRGDIHGKLEEARRTLGLTVQGYQAFSAEEEELLRTGMTEAQFDKFIGEVWERTDEDSSKNARTRETKRDETLHELFAFESNRLGGNRFAAEMALTGYWDNIVRFGSEAKSKVARATALLEGEDQGQGKLKNRVHRQLLELR